MKRVWWVGLIALPLASLSAMAQESGPGKQDLSQAANDPTASVMSLQIGDWYSFNYHNLDDGYDNAIALRAAIPFQTGDLNHIFRVTAPIITDNPVLGSGLSDLTVFDLLVFNESLGSLGRRCCGSVADRWRQARRRPVGCGTGHWLCCKTRQEHPRGAIQSKPVSSRRQPGSGAGRRKHQQFSTHPEHWSGRGLVYRSFGDADCL